MLSDDVVVGDRPCIGQLIHAYHQTHGSVVAVQRVPAEETGRYGVIGGRRGRAADERASPSGRPGGREARSRRCAVGPRGDRALCAHAQDLRQARADPARCRWRDPAHGCDRGADRRPARPRLRVRGHALRRRHDDGLAAGLGRAGAPATGPRDRVPGVPPRPRSRSERHARSRRTAARYGTCAAGAARSSEVGAGGDRRRPGRSIPAGRAAGAGRDGDDLPCPGRPARARRRGQGAAARVRARPGLRGPIPAGGPGGRLAGHPNIVAVFDYGQDGQGPYIVMELVDGEDLSTIVGRNGPLPPRQAARHHGRCRPGARGGPRPGLRPPRREAEQRPAHARRPGQGRRLRHRPGGRGGPDHAARHDTRLGPLLQP